MLEVRLLGQFDLQVDGQPVKLPTRLAQSLLAYLLLNAGIAHRREKLAGFFWPDVLETSARSSLRQTLLRIRQAIETAGHTYLRADNITIAFAADAPYWLDSAALSEPLREDASADELIRLLSLYKG